MKKTPINPDVLAEILKNKSRRLAYDEGIKISNSLLNTKNKITLDKIIDFNMLCLKNVDQYFEFFHKQVNKKPTCNKGCDACCKYPIFVSKLEYETIKKWIDENLSDDIKKIIVENFYNWESIFNKYKKQWQGQKVQEFYSDIIYKTFLDDKQYNEYTSENVKCPFLQNSLCSIYDVRPITCRIYYSYGNSKDCSSELFPKGTISYDCARYNIYKVPLVNSFYPQDEMIDYVNTVDLLPLWFLNNMKI